MEYKVGDILICEDGDFLEYLGEGKAKWLTFYGISDHDYAGMVIRINQVQDMTIRKTTKLERALR